MTENDTTLAGMILLCDKHGQIQDIIRHSFPLESQRNQSFPSLIQKDSRTKALRFIETILHKGSAVEWELNIFINGQIEALLFTGIDVGDKIVILGGRSNEEVTRLSEQLTLINNEQSNLVRQLFKEINLLSKTNGGGEGDLFEELMNLNNELVNLQRELTKKNQQLRTLNEQKSHFLGIAAHDLRNPLGVIERYSEFLIEEASGRLTSEQLEFIAIIKASSKFMLGLVEELLDVSKIESGKLALNLEPTDLVAVCTRVIKVNRVFAAKKQIQLESSFDDDIPEMLLDPQKIEQVLNNLISNAVKYSSPETETVITLKIQDETLLLSVKDQGQGIPEGELGKLFQPFKTTSVKSTAGEKSTGLGLFLVKKMIDGHEGRIWVESEVGKGSTFYVSIPIRRPQNGTVKRAEKDRSVSQLSGKRILLVEDDPDNQRLAERILQKAGVVIKIAPSGEDALTCLEHEAFDCILMDIEMPDMNGLETTAAIREKEENLRRHTPIIALSAHTGRSQEFLEAGMDGCLSKPFNRKELIKRIAELLAEFE